MEHLIQKLFFIITGFVLMNMVIVTVHEFGHYWVARRFNVYVEKFSIGFGRAIWSRTLSSGMVVAICRIPLGGYIKIHDRTSTTKAPYGMGTRFDDVTLWKRILILVAGPGVNLIGAIVIYTLLFMSGVSSLKPVVGYVENDSLAQRSGLQSGDLVVSVNEVPVESREQVLDKLIGSIGSGKVSLAVRGSEGAGELRKLHINAGRPMVQLTNSEATMPGLGFEFWAPDIAPVIGTIDPLGAAAKAGLQVGDKLIAVNDRPLTSFQPFARWIRTQPNQQIKIDFERHGQRQQIAVVVPAVTVAGKEIGRIGIMPILNYTFPEAMRTVTKVPFVEALEDAASRVANMTIGAFTSIWKILNSQISIKAMSGTVSVAQYSGIALKSGADTFFGLMALLSVSVAVFNLLPLPILDGGQICFQVVEHWLGVARTQSARLMATKVSVCVLLTLVCVTFINDLSKW